MAIVKRVLESAWLAATRILWGIWVSLLVIFLPLVILFYVIPRVLFERVLELVEDSGT